MDINIKSSTKICIFYFHFAKMNKVKTSTSKCQGTKKIMFTKMSNVEQKFSYKNNHITNNISRHYNGWNIRQCTELHSAVIHWFIYRKEKQVICIFSKSFVDITENIGN